MRIRRIKLVVLVLLFLSSGAATRAWADVLFDTIRGGAFFYNPNPPQKPEDYDHARPLYSYGAAAIHPYFTGRITHLSGWVSSDTTESATIKMYADTDADVPNEYWFNLGEIIDEWSIDELGPVAEWTTDKLFSIDIENGPILQGNERYWLYLDNGSEADDIAWRASHHQLIVAFPVLESPAWSIGDPGAHYNTSGAMIRIEGDHIGDFDGDADVDFADFTVFIDEFTGTLSAPSASTIPEPAAIALMATGLILITTRRRRS